MTKKPSYSRVLVKLSGEALAREGGRSIDPTFIDRMAKEIASLAALGVEVVIVVGGGNIFRGVSEAALGMERTTADSIGMLATVINGLALQNALEKQGIDARTMSAIPMPAICETYVRALALRHLHRGRVLVLAGGTGNPYFTTDTAAALRAAEMGCGALLKATKVDGVYSSDPVENPEAVRYECLSYQDILGRNLQVMDSAAIALARDNALDILVFSTEPSGVFADVVCGKGRYTLVSHGDRRPR